MTPADYDRYLAAFNGRDYDGVLSFLHPEVTLDTMGYRIRGHQGVRDFYGWFHQYAREEITPLKIASDGDLLFVEARMRLTGLKELSQAELDRRGFGRFTAVPEGLSVDVILFLHYELEVGRFRQIRCASYLPAE
jgi:ketosteroid isomerase-like protein